MKRPRPLERRVNECATRLDSFQQLQSRSEYSELHVDVPGRAKGITHRMIYKETAGRFNLRSEIAAGGDTHGRNTRLFCNPAYQTHGLVIERSRRYSNQQVDFVLLQLSNKRRRGFLQDPAAIVDPTHETTPEAPGDTAELSSCNHFA